MTNVEIISEKPISMNELREELEKIKKRDGELNFRASKTEEYLQHFISLKDYKELFKDIEALNIPRFKEQYIVKIIDVMPTNLEDLKSILRSYIVTISDANLKKIMDIIDKFTAKK